MSDIKVTDKRMFTADGHLREEYRDIGEPSSDEPEAPPAPVAQAAAPEPEPPATVVPEPPRHPSMSGAATSGAPTGGAPTSGPLLELPDTGPSSLGQPSFYDLAAILAEPVQVYLGDLPLPDGASAENLEMARLHIDVLTVLRQKTAGNLTAQESAFLEDLLYRLRLRYVQKRG